MLCGTGKPDGPGETASLSDAADPVTPPSRRIVPEGRWQVSPLGSHRNAALRELVNY